MKSRSLFCVFAAAAAVILLLALFICIQKKEAEAIKTIPVYVDADSLMKDFAPDFLAEEFNDVPDELAISETINDVPVTVQLKLEDVYYVHDTSEFEEAVYKKLVEEKNEQLKKIMAVMDASADLAMQRNITVGLMQLNPLFDEYDEVGREKLKRLFEENNIRRQNTSARLYSAILKRQYFNTQASAERLGALSAESNMDKNLNNQLFLQYMSVFQQYKEQEVNKVLDELNDKLSNQVAEAKRTKTKNYEGYLAGVSKLFDDKLNLDRNTYMSYYTMPRHTQLVSDAKSVKTAIKQEKLSSDEKKYQELMTILKNIADEMGVQIVFEPKRNIPNYTEMFRKKLKDSWQFTPGIISGMEG